MTQNTHRFRGFQLTVLIFKFADWLKFSLIEELTYEIDVKARLLRHVWLGHCFKAVTLPYLLLIRSIHRWNGQKS
jgi:hypothetical protein